MLIQDFIEKANRLFPFKEAIVCQNERYSYSEVYKRTKKLAVFFQNNGIEKGDVISILHQNCHCFLEAYFACAFCGAILNSINFRLTLNDISYILKHSEAKLLISNLTFKDTLEKIKQDIPCIILTDKHIPEQSLGLSYQESISGMDENKFCPIEINENDTAHLYYTSGTTGKPKGVMLSHKNVTIHSLCAIAEFGLSDKDNWLHAAPMFHLADAWATFAITAVGGKHIISETFKTQKVLNLIEKELVTISNLIPTMLNLLVNSKEINDFNLESLRVILSGGAPIAPKLVRKIIEKFGCDYIQTYGMTETSPYLTVSILKEHLKHLPYEKQLEYKSRTGREFLGVQLKIIRDNGNEIKSNGIEVGEIIVKGDIVTKGYWKMPDETKKTIKNGWLYTGDMANIDNEGYVNIVDRKDDVIISGGENVYSIEVEYVLYEHPAILEAAVIGIPDEKWGEAVHAVVALKNGKSATENDIINFARKKLAQFKVPKSVEFINSLPKTGSGKITKHPLKKK